MKLSEKQAIILLDHYKDTLGLRGISQLLPTDQRLAIYNEIINQQSDTPYELDRSKRK